MMSIGRGTLKGQAAHSVMASALMAGSNIQTENFHYWFRTFDLGACTCMEHAHQIIFTHSTPDVTHIYWVKFKPKFYVHIHHQCIVSSLMEEPLNKSMGDENLFFYQSIFTWVEEVLFILSLTLGIWYNLILRYSGSFFEDCIRLIFFCCNLIPKGEEQKKTLKGQIQPSLKKVTNLDSHGMVENVVFVLLNDLFVFSWL